MRTHTLVFSLVLASACTNRNDTGDTFPWEVGCIEVEGVDGKFNFVNDAVEYGGDAPVITLCNGFMPVLETIAITKPTTIIGGGGGRSVLSAPTNEPLMQVASGITLTMDGVKLQSTRNALEVYEGAEVILTDVTFDSVQNWGIEARDATITIADSEFTEVGGGGAGYGGIYMNGGNLDVSGTTFNRAYQWGIRGENRAQVTLTDNVFQNTTLIGDGTILNGFAVSMSDLAEATLTNNVFSNNVIGGLHLETGGAVLNGDRFDGDYVGIWAENPARLDATGVRIHNASRYGAALISAQNVVFNDVEITAVPEEVAFDDLATTDVDEGSFGVIAVDASVTWDGGKVEGYNSVGFRMVTQLSTGSALTASNVDFINNGRIGLQAIIADVSLTNVGIEGTRADPDYCQANDNISCDMGAWLQESNVDWTGGHITNNEGWGALVFRGSLDVTDVTVTGSGLDGLYLVDAALIADNTTFDAAGENGVFAIGSAMTIRDSLFQNGRAWSFSEASNTETSGAGIDIAAFSDSSVIVSNSVFDGGDTAIDMVQGSVVVTDSTITNYRRRAIDGFIGTKLVLRDVDIVDSGPYAVSCSSVDSLVLEDVSINNGIPWAYEIRRFDLDGNLVETTVQYRHGPALDFFSCPALLEDVLVNGTDDTALSHFSAPLEIDGLTVRDTGISSTEFAYAVDVTIGTGSVADVVVDDLTITGVANGGGLSLVGSRSTSGDARPADDLVELAEVSLGTNLLGSTGIAGDGMLLAGFTSGTLDGLRIEATGGDGLVLRDTSLLVTGTTDLFDGGIHDAGGNGLTVNGQAEQAHVASLVVNNTTDKAVELNNSSAELTDLTITNVSGPAIHARGYNVALTLNGATVTGAAQSGITLIDGEHSLTNVTIDQAGTVGMLCEGDDSKDPVLEQPTFTACDDMVVTGVEDDHIGCDTCLDSAP